MLILPNIEVVFLSNADSAEHAYIGVYDHWMVASSIFTAFFASFCALEIISRKTRSFAWMVVAAVILGLGIWAMHFQGMLAFRIDCGVSYDPWITILSILPGITAAAIALHLISRGKTSLPDIFWAGLILGSGVGVMHYSGMAALRFGGVLRYDFGLFLASLLAAIVLAISALWVKAVIERTSLSGTRYRVSLVAGAVLGCAISAMHYIAMEAVYLIPADANQTAFPLENALMGPIVGITMMALSLVGLLLMIINSRADAAIRRNQAIISVMHQGFMMMDHNGIVLEVNAAMTGLLGMDKSAITGKRFSLFVEQQDGDVSDGAQGECTLHRADGSVLSCRIDGGTVSNDQGEKFSFALFTNITARITMENELRSRKQQFIDLLDSTPDPMVVVDQSGKVVMVNQQAETFFGYDRTEIIGQLVEMLMPMPFRAGHQNQRGSYTNKGRTRTMGQGQRLLALVRDGREVPVEISLSQIKSDNGLLVASSLRDITSRVKLEDALNRERSFLKSVGDAVGEGVFALDRDGNCTFFNRAAEELLGWNFGEVFGKNLLDLIHFQTGDGDSLLRSKCLAMDANLNGKPYSSDDEMFTRKDGSLFPVSLIAQPLLSEGEIVGSVAAFHDITAQLRIQEELRSSAEKAEAANRAKTAFLSNMSHEIRTPLNAVIGMTSLLLRRVTKSENVETLIAIKHAGQHLLGLINDILDYSKIDAGKLELSLTDFDVRGAVEMARSNVAGLAATKGLSLTVEVNEDIPLWAHGDPLRIRQCLLNYLNNAIKFTERGSVSLRVIKAGESADGVVVRFEVIDTGLGVPSAMSQRLFADFEQADASISRKYGGTGLGLAITKRLALMMGGDVGFESEPGNGSRFWFMAVLGRASEQSRVSPSVQDVKEVERQLKTDFYGARILLAEDNLINQQVVLGMLAEVGLTASVVPNGSLAVEASRTAVFDLILMDMQMPEMDGLEATQAIRLLPNGRTVPIVAMTANAFIEDRQNCLAAGMNDHLAKPILPETLYEVLLKWLKAPAPVSPAQPGQPMGEAAALSVENDEDRLWRFLGTMEHIDLNLGLKFNRRVNRYIRVLGEYAVSYGKDASRIKELLVSGEAAEARRVAHSLKGSSAMLGIVGVQGPAGELEKAILDNADMDVITKLLDLVTHRYAAVSDAIRTMVDGS